MGRPKSYERQAVLARITEVFWTRGFEATTIAQLERATGLDRRSLFNDFGGKEQMFAEALACFQERKAGPGARVLGQAPAGIANVEAFFRAIRYEEPDELGCLLVLTMLERDSVPADAYATAQGAYRGLEQAMLANLQPAVHARRLPPERAEALAAFLVTALYGIIVGGRAGRSNAELDRIVDEVLAVLPRTAEGADV